MKEISEVFRDFSVTSHKDDRYECRKIIEHNDERYLLIVDVYEVAEDEWLDIRILSEGDDFWGLFRAKNAFVMSVKLRDHQLNKGLGKLIYGLALKHFGTLSTKPAMISPMACRLWYSLIKTYPFTESDGIITIEAE